MTMLVTGAAGFVGAEVAQVLVRAGHDVHVVIRPGTAANRIAGSGATVHRIDLHHTDQLSALVSRLAPSTVVHAAAATHGVVGRARQWADTVLATASLLDALTAAPPRTLVNLGSAMEYAPSERPLRETDPLIPVFARGAAKLGAATAVHQWATELGVELTHLRLFRVYGADEPPGRLVPLLVASLQSGAPVPLPQRPVARDWVHVADVAEACRRAAEDDAGHDALNVGFGVSRTVEEVVKAFERAGGRDIPVVPGAFEPAGHDVTHWCADLGKLEATWGWRPMIDLDAGAARVVDSTDTLPVAP